MKVKIVSWNVRGLNGDKKREFVRKLLHQWGVDIYVLVETKIEGSLDKSLPSIWSNRWVGGIHKEAQGSSGGILILWDKRVWKGELMGLGNQCITGKFTGINENLS